MGTDMLLSLDRWREPDEIFRLSYPVYIRRESDEALNDSIVNAIARYQGNYGKVVRRIVAPAIELCSGDIRAAVAEGRPIDHMTPPAVAAYIRDHDLYRNKPD